VKCRAHGLIERALLRNRVLSGCTPVEASKALRLEDGVESRQDGCILRLLPLGTDLHACFYSIGWKHEGVLAHASYTSSKHVPVSPGEVD